MPITASDADPAARSAAPPPGRAAWRSAGSRSRPSSAARRPGSPSPAVGASTWASGSQVWNGNIGTLIAKARAKARKSQRLQRRGRRACAASARDVEGARPVIPVEHQDRHQHEHAAREGVEEELHRRVDAPVVAPDPDEEVHRDEHGLPEHVEEEEVEGARRPRSSPASSRSMKMTNSRTRSSIERPGAEQAQRGQEGGEDDEPEREPVDADVVADALGRDPGALLDELHARPRPRKPRQQERARARRRRR